MVREVSLAAKLRLTRQLGPATAVAVGEDGVGPNLQVLSTSGPTARTPPVLRSPTADPEPIPRPTAPPHRTRSLLSVPRRRIGSSRRLCCRRRAPRAAPLRQPAPLVAHDPRQPVEQLRQAVGDVRAGGDRDGAAAVADRLGGAVEDDRLRLVAALQRLELRRLER